MGHICSKYAARWPPSTHTVRQERQVCGPNNPNFSQRMPTPPWIQASTVVLLLYYVYYFYRHDSNWAPTATMLTSTLRHLGASTSCTPGTYTGWIIPSTKCDSTSKICITTRLFHFTFMALPGWWRGGKPWPTTTCYHHPGIPTPMGGPLLAHLTCPSQLTWSTMQQLLPVTNDGVLHPGSISAAAAFPAGLRQGLTIQELDADGRVLHRGTISAAAAHPAGPRRRLTAQQLDVDGSCYTLAPSAQQQPFQQGRAEG